MFILTIHEDERQHNPRNLVLNQIDLILINQLYRGGGGGRRGCGYMEVVGPIGTQLVGTSKTALLVTS